MTLMQTGGKVWRKLTSSRQSFDSLLMSSGSNTHNTRVYYCIVRPIEGFVLSFALHIDYE